MKKYNQKYFFGIFTMKNTEFSLKSGIALIAQPTALLSLCASESIANSA
jgi:hypothetical protein